MTNVSAEELVGRLRQALSALLQWAEAYEPGTIGERSRYDADLDEAEDVLADADAWMGPGADPWWRGSPPGGTPTTGT